VVTQVLKSTGSAFENFVRDEYTTLAEVEDRIFSTSVDLRYTYGEVALELPRDEKRLIFGEQNFDRTGAEGVHAWEDAKVGVRARETTMDVFARDESASVQVRSVRGNEGAIVADDVNLDHDMTLIMRHLQATLYKMAQRVLAENAGVESVRYVLPNKHYIPVDMKYIGVDNTTP
jgi:urate oxidase